MEENESFIAHSPSLDDSLNHEDLQDKNVGPQIKKEESFLKKEEDIVDIENEGSGWVWNQDPLIE